MTPRFCTTVVVLASALSALGACTSSHARLPAYAHAQTASCRRVVDATGATSSVLVQWDALEDDADRETMAAGCESVGPAVYIPPSPPVELQDLPGAIVVVSWNVHVGGGDLRRFIADLRRGRFTAGAPVRAFVLLLQEAFRRGPAVPANIPAGAPVPRRIAPSPSGGSRTSITEVARSLGLALFYLPSMRNGAEDGAEAEDRGNAILSTIPLSHLEAIELPFARQRRVAIAARLTRPDGDERPSLLVVSSHLNATAGASHLWIFASGLRQRQSQTLRKVLSAHAEPAILGADLNTWADGPREPAYTLLRSDLPDGPPPGRGTFLGALRLDYLLFRVPAGWRAGVHDADDTYGSDHRPVIGWIEPSPTTAAGPGVD